MSKKCDACFLECEPRDKAVSKRGEYPCSLELRMWARAHRNDKGDELGYVREVKDDRYRA